MLIFGLAGFLGAIYFVVYFWGLGRSFPQFENTFTTMEKPIIAIPWDSPIWSNLSSEKAKRVAAWVDVYRSKDGSLRALPSQFRPAPQDPVDQHLENQGPSLSEGIKPHLQRPLILNVVSNTDHIDTQINTELGPLNLKQVLVQSEYDNVMLSIKTFQPMWAYGASAADRVRWNMFASLGLTPAVTFGGDVYVSPLKVRNLNPMNISIQNEIKRRSLLLMIGPLDNVDEVRQAQAFEPAAYFVTSPEAFDALP